MIPLTTMTIVGRISKSKYVNLIPVIIFIVYLTHTMRNINLDQKLIEARRLVKRSADYYDPTQHLQQPKQQKQHQLKQHQQQPHNQQQLHHQQQQPKLNSHKHRNFKMFNVVSNEKIEYDIIKRVKRQTPPKKKAVTTKVVPPTPPPLPPAPDIKVAKTTATTTTTTKATTLKVEVQVHPELQPLPTLPTYTLKPSKLDIKLVNPEGETITFATSNIGDLSVDQLSDLLEAEIQVQDPFASLYSKAVSAEIQILQEEEIDSHAFRLEFDEYFDVVQSMIPKLESRLKEQIKRLDPKPKVFSELDNFYYFSSKYEYSFGQGLQFCAMHKAKYYEISDFNDYNILVKLKNEDGKSMHDYIVWVDVEISDEGIMSYQSGKPMGTILKIDTITNIPNNLPENHCMTFNPITIQYEPKPCTEKYKIVCRIDKTDEIRQKLANIDNVEGYIRLAKKQKLGKVLLRKIKENIKLLPKANCDVLTHPVIPLFQHCIELIKTISLEEINWHKFPKLFDFFLNDIESMRRLDTPVTFIENFDNLMITKTYQTSFYDEVNNVVCKMNESLVAKTSTTEAPRTPTKAPEEILILNDPKVDLDLVSDADFYKFNLTDFILAITSLVVTIIAVTNSVYLVYQNKCKGKIKLNKQKKEDEEKKEKKKLEVPIHSILKKNVTLNLDGPPQKTFVGTNSSPKVEQGKTTIASSPVPARVMKINV